MPILWLLQNDHPVYTYSAVKTSGAPKVFSLKKKKTIKHVKNNFKLSFFLIATPFFDQVKAYIFLSIYDN